MFEALENSLVAIWVSESLWAYPLLLSVHIIGLAAVVGIFSLRDLRLLGLFSSLSPNAFIPLAKLAWAGFALNAVSGFMLFSSQASTFVSSIPFLTKICSIAMAMVLAGLIQSRLAAMQEDGSSALFAVKCLALISLVLWLTAIIAGRLIAYIF